MASRALKDSTTFRARQLLATMPPGPDWPEVYSAPPTLSVTAGIGPLAGPVNSGTYDLTAHTGQLLGLLTATAAQVEGDTVLTLSSMIGVKLGQEVRHGENPDLIPAGTTITAIDGSTVTLSNPLAGAVSNGDYIGVGPDVVSFLGAVWGFRENYSPFMHNVCTGVNSGTKSDFAIEFDHIGDDVGVYFRSMSGTVSFWVWVDGQPVTAAPVSYSEPSGDGDRCMLRILFNHADDNTARMRRVRVYMHYAHFGGVAIEPDAAISASRTKYPRVAIFGDSWIEGAGGAVSFTQIISSLIGQAFGTVPFICGQGGTGYIADGPSYTRAFTDSDRLAQLIATGADLVLILGSVNDATQTKADVQTAAAGLFATVKAGLPYATIIVAGVQPTRASIDTIGTNTNYTGPNDGIKAAAEAAGLPFIDWLNYGWVTGTGNAGSPAGDGNADLLIYSDSIHPNPEFGPVFFARRLADEIATRL